MKLKELRVTSIHIASVIVFIAYETSVVYVMGSRAPLKYFLLYYIPDLAFFYFVAYALLPYWNEGKKWIVFTGVALAVTIHLIAYSHIDIYVRTLFLVPFTRKEIWVRAVYRVIYVLGISSSFWNAKNAIQQANEINDLKLQALEQRNKEIELENAVLRARVDPHLLFNTLNFCYTGIEIKSPKEAKALDLLSQIMKFSLRHPDANGKVPLKDELAFINTYVELNQLLNGHKLQIRYTVKEHAIQKGLTIPPILLMEFTQDVFKHGNLKSPGKPATITVKVSGRHLNFQIENAVAVAASHEGMGIGLDNTRKRLQQHYNNDYRLDIQQSPDYYKLDLNIAL